MREEKSVVKRVKEIKTRVNEEKGDSIGNGKVKRVADTAEVTNVAKAGARKEGNLFGQK